MWLVVPSPPNIRQKNNRVANQRPRVLGMHTLLGHVILHVHGNAPRRATEVDAQCVKRTASRPCKTRTHPSNRGILKSALSNPPS